MSSHFYIDKNKKVGTTPGITKTTRAYSDAVTAAGSRRLLKYSAITITAPDVAVNLGFSATDTAPSEFGVRLQPNEKWDFAIGIDDMFLHWQAAPSATTEMLVLKY